MFGFGKVYSAEYSDSAKITIRHTPSYNCAYVGSRWLTYFLFKRTYIRCPMSRSNFEAVVMDTVYAVIHVE